MTTFKFTKHEEEAECDCPTKDPDSENHQSGCVWHSRLEQEVELPGRWEICGRCRGEGKHTNPAIDGHGISPEEFEEDPDFEEGYRSGLYDVSCEAGCADGKVLVPDEQACLTAVDPNVYRLYLLWEEQSEQEARWDEEDRRTRLMESGGYG